MKNLKTIKCAEQWLTARMDSTIELPLCHAFREIGSFVLEAGRLPQSGTNRLNSLYLTFAQRKLS